MNPTTITDDAVLAATARASGYGTRFFSYNDLCTEIGFVRGKGPRWNNRQKILSGNRVSRLLTTNGYAVHREYPSRTSTRRYYLLAVPGMNRSASRMPLPLTEAGPVMIR